MAKARGWRKERKSQNPTASVPSNNATRNTTVTTEFGFSTSKPECGLRVPDRPTMYPEEPRYCNARHRSAVTQSEISALNSMRHPERPSGREGSGVKQIHPLPLLWCRCAPDPFDVAQGRLFGTEVPRMTTLQTETPWGRERSTKEL